MKLKRTTPTEAVKSATLQDLESLEARIAALEAAKAPESAKEASTKKKEGKTK